MTTATLAPMRAEAFTAFFDTAVAAYAGDNVAAGRWRADEAPALARAETERLLPQGAATPEHHLLEIVDGGTAVGFLWFAAMSRGSTRVAFVYQIYVHAGFRRRGHARAALQALEGIVGGLGLAGIALHVFGSNTGAQALYRSLGYGTTSLNLFKPLGSQR